MNNIVLGKYLHLDSFFHRLDPRAKLLGLFMMLVAIFINAGWYGYGLIAVAMLLALRMSKIRLIYILKSLKPLIMMLFFLLVVNVLVVKTGDLLIRIYGFGIYSNAVFNTLYILVRLLLMVMITSVLTATTKPFDLTMGIESLLAPFAKIGLPHHDIAMMISIALRFIPTIIEETYRIMNAQKSRGVDFDEGTIKEKINAVLSLIVPLFGISITRAMELANAMEARSYVPGQSRTRFRQLKYRRNDFVMLAFIVILIIVLLVIAYAL